LKRTNNAETQKRLKKTEPFSNINKKQSQTAAVNHFTNMDKTNNHLSSKIAAHNGEFPVRFKCG
jgi:hypothetical protein